MTSRAHHLAPSDARFTYGDGPHWFDMVEAGTAERTDGATVVHLVLLDGRLVESWSESARGTRWEHLVENRPRPVVQLPRDENQDLLDWLAGLCGSRAALDALSAEDLVPASAEQPSASTGTGALPTGELDEHLGRLRDACFDDEAVLAMRRAAAVLATSHRLTSSDLTSLQRAAGVAWVVAKANGLFGHGLTSPSAVQHALGLTSTITTAGRAVERALVGPLPFEPRRPVGAPDLLSLGRPDLLVGTTRRALISWRDRAAAAQAAAESRHPCTVCSPP